MKKIFLIICFIFYFVVFTANGQQKYFMQKQSFDYDIKVGVKVGINFAKMAYTDDRLNGVTQNFMPRPMCGITAEIPIAQWFSISPELMYMSRGTFCSYNNRVADEEKYSIITNDVDIRLPILFNIPINGANHLYFYLAPDLSYTFGGSISLVAVNSLNQQIPIGKSNMRPINFGLAGGGGLRFNVNLDKFLMVVRIEAGYNYGFTNTFSDQEINNSASAVNVNAYEIKGTRQHRGIETALVLMIPITNTNPLCNYKSNYRY